MTKECEKMVHEQTVCVYLRTSVDELVARLAGEASGRPLLKTADLRTRILDLMSRRSSTYERAAHLIIDTDGKSISEIAVEISNQLIA
jgi:shikimate kinase